MRQYLNILGHILSDGLWKENRTKVRTLTTFLEVIKHDMVFGFPLLTTKKMDISIIAVELEGFIKGITSKKWYQDRGCNIWNEWANPKKNTKNRKEEDDLGPIYGYQWRGFNQCYDEDDNGWVYNTQNTDQLKTILETLKNNAHDRRMVCSAWNPLQMDYMALPPCHYAFNVVVIAGRLNLVWNQRSCDFMLGVPYNLASYALLLLLLCKESGLRPGIIGGTLHDCHIYENHLEQAYKQLDRTTSKLPTLEITNWKGIFEWTHKDIELKNYKCKDRIKFEVAI